MLFYNTNLYDLLVTVGQLKKKVKLFTMIIHFVF